MRTPNPIKKMLEEKAKEFISLCTLNKVPVVVIFAVNDANSKTETVSYAVTPTKAGITLTEDKITPLLPIIGTDKFRIVPLQQEEIFDESAFFPDDASEEE